MRTALALVAATSAALLLSFGPAVANDPAAKRPNTPEASERKSGGPHLIGHGGPVKAMAARDSSPSNAAEINTEIVTEIVTGSFDYSMIHWRLGVDGKPVVVGRYDDHDGAVSAVTFLPDGRQAAAGSDDGAIHIWNLENTKRSHKLSGHTAKVLGLDVSPNGRQLASASWDSTVRIWDLTAGKELAVLKGHKGPVNAVRFSHDGTQLVSASYDGTLSLWDVKRGALIRAAYKHGWGINVLERLPQTGRYVFGALDGTTAIVDIERGELIGKLMQRDKPILSLTHITKPGLLAVGGGDGLIDVYRTGDWKRLEQHKNPYGPVWAMTFADRGARIYYGSLDDHATAWQVTPRKPFEAAAVTKFPRRFQVKNAALGERQFARKCSICHTLSPDGRNRAGPTLYGVFGRRIATLPGYPYSEPLKKLDIVWNEETIAKLFELGPHKFTPGSKMPLQKITDVKKRDALIAFLKQATAPK
ncbi:MAG: c-type cytochrome [Hyphomicrobiaceae bacterium]